MTETNLFKKISIIVPAYNVEDYLPQCIESLINQTFKNIEIIIINDGSTDDSGKICDHYAALDKRIQVIHKPNQGIGMARNDGLEKSTGEYIYFVDADDWIDARCVESFVASIRESSPDLLIFGFQKHKNGKKFKSIVPLKGRIEKLAANKDDLIRIFNNQVGLTVWNKVFRSEVIKANQVTFGLKKRGEDFAFVLDYLKHAEKVVSLDSSYYNYRVQMGVSEKYDDQMIDNHIENFENLFSYFRVPLLTKISKEYLLRVFVLWFAIVIPMNVANKSDFKCREKMLYYEKLFARLDFLHWLKVLRSFPGSLKSKLLFQIINFKSPFLLLFFAQILCFLRRKYYK